MIREFIARVKSAAKKRLEAGISLARNLGSALLRFLLPVSSGVATPFFVLSVLRNARGAGKRYRRTSGHAPIFSLYTFFALRL
jgi:hypothetical protein